VFAINNLQQKQSSKSAICWPIL